MGKLEEMLASGRAPGILVRGAYARDPLPVEMPLAAGRAKSRAQMQQELRRGFEAAALEEKRRRSGSRRRDGEMRLLGVTPIEEVTERLARGEDDVLHDREKFLRDTGSLFDHEK